MKKMRRIDFCEMLRVESCSSALEPYTPSALLAGDLVWLSAASPARAVLVFDRPTPVKNVFVRNAGSSHVEVDAMVDGDGFQWVTLLNSAQLQNENRDLFLARFFARELSLQLDGVALVKLRVTITSELGCFGLSALRVNISDEERDELRAEGAGRAPEVLATASGTVPERKVAPLPPLPPVKGKSPKKPAAKEPKTEEKKKSVSGATKKALRVEIDLADDSDEFEKAPVAKKSKSEAVKKVNAPAPILPVPAKAKMENKSDRKSLLKGVVFGVSGLENPERSNVRDLALSMGATYSHVWGKDATHLLLACAGTPKHKEQQASGHGVAVHYKWVEECSKQEKRVAESDFSLDKGKKSPSSDVGPKLVKSPSLAPQSFPSLAMDDDDVIVIDGDEDIKVAGPAFPHLPDFFSPVMAWIDMDDSGLAGKVKRLVIAYGGKVKEDVPNGCTHYVTDKGFGGAPGAMTVTPQYIESCCAKQILI